MAQPKWLDKYLTMKPEVNQIFEDLEKFREFCADYGHPYDERNLYNERSHVYQDFQRAKTGKWVRNAWFDRGDRKPREKREYQPRGNNNYRSGYNRNA